MQPKLDRLEPKNFDHVSKYPLSAVGLDQVQNLEKLLVLPPWHMKHDQGEEGACVGHGVAMGQAILNSHQCRLQGAKNPYIRYNPWWLWDRAKEIDEFPETNPGDDNGTTVRAAFEIARSRGLAVWDIESNPKSIINPGIESGIKTYRWARDVNEVRLAINANTPVSIGVNWYSNFDKPIYRNGEYWIGIGGLGSIRGGHCVCVYGASDQRQAVRVKNSWGPEYPEVWLSYGALQRLLRENGEVGLVTDL